MDAPKCRLCGEKHYGLCPSFKTAPVQLDGGRPKRNAAIPAQREVDNRSKADEGQKPKSRSGLAGSKRYNAHANSRDEAAGEPAGFDRVAYQRNYMRGYRARKKDKT